jgi:ABC-type branched-subunit amino acid transport system ATPase component/ABC-type branched-subunit amino acid transport system permease subunit
MDARIGTIGPPAGGSIAAPSLARRVIPFAALFGAAACLPLFAGDYWGLIAARACAYWVLVSGLNLVVGFAGQIAIGWVALLTLGAYTTSVLVAGNVLPALSPYLALAIAAVAGAAFGLIIGLPALRLRTFYFAMVTLGFATILTQIALAWQSVTGGGIGIAGPTLTGIFAARWGLFYFCLAAAVLCTWMSANIAYSRFGRGMVAIRDAEVAAEAAGVSKAGVLVAVFLFSGATAAVSGGLFAALQSYITPDAFTFDLSVLFFIAILIGGRGSVLGPLLGTIILTVLPEFAAPLVAWSTFLYAALLLLIVLIAPGGIAELLDFRNRRPLQMNRAIVPNAAVLADVLDVPRPAAEITLERIVLSFGGVRAIDDFSLTIRRGEVHGLIGPNGSGKTTTLNVISGYYRPEAGRARVGPHDLLSGTPESRARQGIARTFQTPRLAGEASVLDNVMVGGTVRGRGSFAESMFGLPRHLRDEAMLRRHALAALRAVGLEALADVRSDRLQHSELRFVEIARALMAGPAFLLLDEPAAGLSTEEISRLGTLITAIARHNVGVLLVEHHADLIFDICDRVSVLNLGRELASGTPAEIRAHKEVVSAYLGA